MSCRNGGEQKLAHQCGDGRRHDGSDTAAPRAQTRPPFFPIRTSQITDEMYLPVLDVLGLLGIVATLALRRFFLLAWFVVILLVNARNPLTPVMVPLSLMIGTAVSYLLVRPLLRLGAGAAPDAPAGAPARGWQVVASRWPALVTGGALTGLVGYLALADLASEKYSDEFVPLGPADRAAMQWVARTTPANSPFLVLTFDRGWFGVDQRAEWFPALTGRPSVGTVQAYEWLPGKQFLKRGSADSLLHLCNKQDASCLDRRALQHGQAFRYVYAGKNANGAPLLASLRTSPGYTPVFENAGVVIFARRQGAAAATPVAPPAVASGPTP